LGTGSLRRGTDCAREKKKLEGGNLVYFPYYDVNDQEYSEGDGFVINFLDEPSDSGLPQVITLKYTEAESEITYSVVPAVNKYLLPNDSVWYRGYFDKRPASLALLMAY
jgi:hypothetical protein